MAAAVFSSRASSSSGCNRKWAKSRLSNNSGSAPACGNTNFNSCPSFRENSEPALGLTQIQSTPGGGKSVPLVSMATSKLLSWNAVRRSASSCNNGSPPVQTTNGRLRRPLPHALSTASARAPAVSNHPPPGPSVPTKSVSHHAEQPPGPFDRSGSRPVQRLQPVNRRNTAGRPACMPSPCSV